MNPMIVIEYIWNYFASPLGIVELIASILTLVCVWQTKNQNIWCWVTGALGVILYGAIFYEVQLYADMTLQWLFFLPMQVYGFWYWATQGSRGFDTTPVTLLRGMDIIYGVPAVIILCALTGFGYSTWTSAALPYWDSVILVLSIVAQILMSRKKLESWLFWIVVDIIAIGVYGYKELYVTSGLYTVLLIMAAQGYRKWYNDWVYSEDNPSRI